MPALKPNVGFGATLVRRRSGLWVALLSLSMAGCFVTSPPTVVAHRDDITEACRVPSPRLPRFCHRGTNLNAAPKPVSSAPRTPQSRAPTARS